MSSTNFSKPIPRYAERKHSDWMLLVTSQVLTTNQIALFHLTAARLMTLTPTKTNHFTRPNNYPRGYKSVSRSIIKSKRSDKNDS